MAPPAGAGSLSGEETRGHEVHNIQKIITGYHDGFPYAAPIGSFAASPLGIFDLVGNVVEWCEDTFPLDPDKHVIRGIGFYTNDRNYALSSHRSHDRQGLRVALYGFRPVLSPAP